MIDPAVLRWKAVPNPLRDDGSFLCIDGPPRFYENGSPRLPEAVVSHQLHPLDAEVIAAEHNKAIESLRAALVQEIEKQTSEMREKALEAGHRVNVRGYLGSNTYAKCEASIDSILSDIKQLLTEWRPTPGSAEER